MKTWGMGLVLMLATQSSLASQFVCEEVLSGGPGKVDVVTSGQSALQTGELTKIAEELSQTAHELGMVVPSHRMTFVPSHLMNALASLGRYALPHHNDGLSLMKNGAHARGVMEFVVSGHNCCRSFNNASNRREEAASITAHVIGHNHVSSLNPLMQATQSDPIEASNALGRRIEELKREVGHDEVVYFVQMLYSMNYMQDMTYGTFDLPELFKPTHEAPTRPVFTGRFGENDPYERTQHPVRQTSSLLQAAKYNLAPNAPAWKSELIDLYEKMVRCYVGNVHTQVMNEGAAVMAQFLLAKHHGRLFTEPDFFKIGWLITRVMKPDIQNVYFMGFEAWWRIRERFRARPDIQGLPEKEKDRRFVLEEFNPILQKNDSYSFLNIGLDQEWFDKKGLYLYRSYQDGDLIRQKPPEDGKPINVVLTRNRERLIRFILRKTVATQLKFPNVPLLNFNFQQKGIALFEHKNIENIPLEKGSMLQSLFVWTQILERPVAIKAFHVDPRTEAIVDYYAEVSPSGEVKIREWKDGKPGEVAGPDSEQAEKVVRAFQDELRGIVTSEYAANRFDPSWLPAIRQVMDANLSPIRELIFAVPYASHAVHEMNKIIKEKLVEKVREMIRSGKSPKPNAAGVGVRLFPGIPMFQYDRQVQMALLQKKPPAPIDLVSTRPNWERFDQDDTSSLGAARLALPGDTFPAKPGGGGGGGGGGQDPGEASESPDVFVDMEFWGRLLADELKLPNLRRTKGESERVTRIRRGSRRLPNGFEIEELTLENALEKAIAIRKKKGLPYRPGLELSRRKLLEEAVKLIDSDDVEVADKIDIALPDFSAVLVVVGDLTGSMTGKRAELAKQIIWNVEALLRAGYNKIIIRYVGFSGKAYEFTKEEFFNKFIGYETKYAEGLKKAKSIFDEYSNATHNKFLLIAGDAESPPDDQKEVGQLLPELTKDLQYISFAVTNERRGFSMQMVDSFLQVFETIKREWPYVGVAWVEDEGDVLPSMKDLFPSEPN